MAYVNRPENVGSILTGQVNDYALPNYIQTAPDDDDKLAIAAADAQYQTQLQNFGAHAEALKNELMDEFHRNPYGDRFKELKAQFEALGRPENQPQKPDPLAIQAQSDRRRLLQMATAAYQPAINDTLAAARGEGPSAALNTYRAAADDAARRNYGMAASAQGTGGQRAALFQAAMGQEAQDRQKAAGQAAIIGAQEQQTARGQLGNLLGGLGNLYGGYLYQGTQNTQAANQGAADRADATNANIASGNATNATNTVRSGFQAAGTAAGGL